MRKQGDQQRDSSPIASAYRSIGAIHPRTGLGQVVSSLHVPDHPAASMRSDPIRPPTSSEREEGENEAGEQEEGGGGGGRDRRGEEDAGLGWSRTLAAAPRVLSSVTIRCPSIRGPAAADSGTPARPSPATGAWARPSRGATCISGVRNLIVWCWAGAWRTARDS